MICKKKRIKIVETCSFSYPKSEELDNHDAILPAIEVDKAIYFALADGVGRSRTAKLAATTAINSVYEVIKSTLSPSMHDIYCHVQSELEKIEYLDSSFEKAATTLVICKIHEEGITIASVGDSRAYITRKCSLKKVTNDHTEKEKLIERGIFTKKELKNHPAENVLTNCIQPFKHFYLDEIRLNHEEVKSGIIILVSDGVYKSFEGKRVIGNVSSIDLLQVSLNIKKRVLKAGVKDDFSLVAVSYN